VQNALHLYIQKTTRENAEGRSWIRQPNNFISAAAFVISILGAGYQMTKDHWDTTDKDLASLSVIVSDLTKLDSEVLTAAATNPRVADNLGIYFANRRVALLEEADRLIDSLGKKAPHAQLAVLAPEYSQVGDYDKALTYFRLLTQPPASTMERLSAWRSIALVYFSEGPAAYDEGRNAFRQAAAVLPDPKDIGSINLLVLLHEQWAQFEEAAQQYAAAVQHLDEARKLVNRFPCMPEQATAAARLDGEGRQAIDELRRHDAAQAEAAQASWAEATHADKCPTLAASAVPPTGDPAVGGTTTICRFLQGPRAGTIFDFAPFGVKGIPVGSPCTDGAGSTGTAIAPAAH
jgi:tetratricopeptide (TPR) repeat protein